MELSQLTDLEKNTLYLVIDLIRELPRLENLAKKGQLLSRDLVFLKQAEEVLQQYLVIIERLRDLNRNR